MDPDVVYAKTAKGLDEIRWRRHKLPARLRALLITIDGKSTAAALVGRFASPEQATAGIAGLLACGFIEVATGLASAHADPLLPARQFMRNSLLATMGADADYFRASLDSARSLEALAELASEFLDVVRASGDRSAADAFIAGLREFGIVQDATWLSPTESPAPKGGA